MNDMPITSLPLTQSPDVDRQDALLLSSTDTSHEPHGAYFDGVDHSTQLDATGPGPSHTAPLRHRDRFIAVVPSVTAVSAVVVGVLGIVGMLTRNHFLVSLTPQGRPIATAGTITLIFMGLGVWAAARAERSQRRSKAPIVAAVLATVPSAMWFGSLFFGANLRVSSLVSRTLHRPDLDVPVGPHTRLAFALMAAWLCTLLAERGWLRRIRPLLAAGTCVVVGYALLGYVFGVQYLFATDSRHGMSIQTLGALILLCIGMLAVPRRDLIVQLSEVDDSGGMLFRILMPTLIVSQVAIAYLLGRIYEGHAINANEMLALNVGIGATLLTGVLIWTAARIHKEEHIRKLLEAQLEELASQDVMTRLANRRSFESELDRQVKLAQRHENHELALVVLDLDGLKPVNDRMGHAAGDILLRGVADCIRARIRTTDFGARLGGDEFALILPHTDRFGAERITRSLIDIIGRTQWDSPRGSVRSTISGGIATFNPAAGMSSEQLFRMADEAMYEAKRAGGSDYRCAVSDTHPDPHACPETNHWRP
jgi:diguanylate cyclase (GGDEF)-like protein